MSNKDDRLSWMDEEEKRSDDNLEKGTTENNKAPLMKRSKKRIAPDRKTRGIFVQEKQWNDFEDLVLAQKKIGGKTKPELAEEALELIIKKYTL